MKYGNPDNASLVRAGIEQLIGPVLPTQVSWALRSCGAPENAASEREMAIVARAVAKRRAEFVAGRSAARAALSRFGLGSTELMAGEHRQPVWPSGIVGSITHAGGVAAAAVAPGRALSALGIDLELRTQESLPTDSVIDPGEQGALKKLAEELGESAFLVYFSAKEAVFKAMYPRHRRYFDFLDVVLEPAPGRTFRCRALPAAPPDPEWRRMRVSWNVNSRFVFSLAWLPAAAPFAHRASAEALV